MKPHRIFIAINLPGGVKDQLLEYKKRWPELPARWVTKDNLHLTLAFLGNTSDQELAEVCRPIQEIGERHSVFELEITHLQYGPDQRRPRMIWALLEKSKELLALQKDIEQTLNHSDGVSYRAEKRPFSPHLTLARLKTFELQHMEIEELPEIREEISLGFHAKSVEVMESRLKRSGAEYTVLQSAPLSE